MKRIYISISAVWLALSGMAFASSPQAEQTRQVPSFDGISTSGAWDIDVRVGPAASVRITGPQDVLDRITTEVIDGNLVIGQKPHTNTHWYKSDPTPHVYVTVPVLKRYSAEGAGETTLHDVTGEQFALSFEGAGALTASGKLKSLNVSAHGAGELNLKGLQADDVTANLEGLGSIYLYAHQSLTASVNGIGSLTYYGHPARMTRSVNGIGSVSAGD
ncbi:MAG: DUF2807 domain-containing protein [Burkholderiales bacterium]|nr:DUF2807 domain-containing protein [Burkholderiales bacterium]